MAYRLKAEFEDGTKVDTSYWKEEYAVNLYQMALLIKGLKYAQVYDESKNSILFEYHKA